MYQDKRKDLHEGSIIIDGLNASNWSDPEVFDHLHRGGLTAINATISVWENFTETLDNIASWYGRFEKFKHIIRPVKTPADIENAKTEGKCGIIFGFQNSAPIEDDLRRLHIFYELGVRIIQVTYNRSNYVGSGYLESSDFGLTNFGLDFVEECNGLGILLDCSHVGRNTTLETIEASSKPIAFTHANPRALYNMTRNKTDEELKALAEKNGVVGAVGYAQFMEQKEKATLADFINIIDYLVGIVGVEHVGIGMDFTQGQSQEWLNWLICGRDPEHVPRISVTTEESQRWLKDRFSTTYKAIYPKGLTSPAYFPNLTQALLENGYSEQDVQKIIGLNFLRLFKEVWK